ncbi:hypothetical protein COT75_00250 [Candidatus Beckwithbacteria bacterium CG10_big_fil_rev_8_21_14_0_10_34_10]|uniref:Peptidase family U32 C-terminal domain-containing protein n=1 Tax=Candidatus Beckwithbacteria bacterium CG10_big_fil_rev_8_21_14_0_10_34_10 TaxID=1974495 RepID=A0A2H0WAC4_9BACT|nr:MAG: hypothetical protein COT75_00250 [Candidatus Beckwithbacteria bacterium CG10_big_fil_rev_8_21_14_0_10_34_10]
MINLAGKQVGTISHYYDQIGVAVLDLNETLKVGDKIKIVKEEEEFEQEISSMQVEHKEVQTAKKGDSVGLKVDKEVKRKSKVYIL